MTDYMSYINAFWVGGLFCVLAQILIDKTKMTPARILVLYVVLGTVLGSIGIYDKLIEFAGAGASVPLVGFGNVLAKGVKKAVDETGLLGVITGGATAAAGGISAAIFFSFIAALIFKPKAKK